MWKGLKEIVHQSKPDVYVSGTKRHILVPWLTMLVIWILWVRFLYFFFSLNSSLYIAHMFGMFLLLLSLVTLSFLHYHRLNDFFNFHALTRNPKPLCLWKSTISGIPIPFPQSFLEKSVHLFECQFLFYFIFSVNRKQNNPYIIKNKLVGWTG